MVDQHSVFSAVPVGQENALAASAIEEIVGVWASRTVKVCLIELVTAGRVHSMTVPSVGRRREVTVYFRPRS